MNSSKQKIILVSNRTPFSFDQKKQKIVKSSGGLVSALLAIKSDRNIDWLGVETDRESASKITRHCLESKTGFHCHPIVFDNELYKKFYDGLCNDVLWPLFHYETQLITFSRENWEAYVKVNELMADAISSKAEAEDLVWIHDFHFFLLPKMLKQRNPRLRVGFFLHIPFPSSEIFRQLPVRNEVLEGLSASDILGFHEYSYLRHFSISLKSCLGIESSLFRADMGQGRYLRLGVYPISVDTQLLKQKACSEKVKTLEKKLKDPLFLLLGVDRLDYTKGIELKLRGFRRALEIYPELRGKMSLLQIAVPTRTRVPAYKRLKTSVDQLVGNINGEYGRPDYTPVRYMFSSVKESELLALYRTANALLVTSKRDGMNLVCMEYLLAQNPKNPGCVILSEFAGASSLLGDVMTINPWDADAMARSIKECFDMNLDERIRRHRKADTTLSVYSASEWAEGFLRDLNTVTNSRQLEAKLISPRASDWPSKLIKLIAQKGRLFLFLDYDGTLAPICDQPSHAVLSEATSQLLKQLGQIPGIEICIVSGRKKEFLEEQFPKNNFHLAAEHGAYFKAQQSQGWENFVSSHLDSWYPDALRMMKDYSLRVPHSYVETKDASLTWHFRQSPSDFAEYQSRKLAEELQIGLANFPVSIMAGSKVVDARAVECNKGDFLRHMVRDYLDGGNYICIGDDRTDEDMFAALDDQGLGIKVGSEPSRAQYQLKNQGEVNIFLANIIETWENPSSFGTSFQALDEVTQPY